MVGGDSHGAEVTESSPQGTSTAVADGSKSALDAGGASCRGEFSAVAASYNANIGSRLASVACRSYRSCGLTVAGDSGGERGGEFASMASIGLE